MSESFLLQAFVYLLAAVVAVPLAKRLGLGSVLGYLLAGVVIGPSVIGAVGDQENLLHFAEFGVVMLLFLVGLECRPALLWRLRNPILGLGGAQLLGTALALGFVATLLGLGWRTALAAGLILAMSSTAIGLQTLAERNQLKLSGGQAAFSVLLFQDIAVIPILALLPVLGTGRMSVAGDHGALSGLPGWLGGLVTLGAVAVIVVVGHYLLRYLFRFVARAHAREVFTATALLLVIGIALLMESVGLSPALGTFLAGVVLADSDYRHELEADIEPFKGLLLGLFFISVGSGIDLPWIGRHAFVVLPLVLGLIGIKAMLLLGLGRIARLSWSQTALFAVALAQGGEFCFVLLQFAAATGVFTPDYVRALVATVALSMACTPLLFTLNERLLQPRLVRARSAREPDEITTKDNDVIIAGFGRFGHIVGRLLRANGIGVTVLDSDPDQVELLGRFGMKIFYGDATRLDLLHAAGAGRAKVFILTLADEAASVGLARMLKREFPHLRIFARAMNRQHAYDLIKAGVQDVHHETLGTALDLGAEALQVLGVASGQAQRAAGLFKEHERASLRDMAGITGAAEYASRARRHIENLERVLQKDRARTKPDDSGLVAPQTSDINNDGEGL